MGGVIHDSAHARPLKIDRAADCRTTADLAAADAVVAFAGSVLALDGRLVEIAPAERPPTSLVIYLGREHDRDLVAVVPQDPSFGTAHDGIGGERMVGLREFFQLSQVHGEAGQRDSELAATAVAISTWHANHPRCAVCGEPTEPSMGGWVRRCAACDKEHYPRTDPAVIVAITDPEDRLLLAHAGYWSARRFSHLAGYVEPGESLEQAVHREVFEEAGLRVRDLEYVGSQPWPFPASVMVGYRAQVDDVAITVDGEEITEARFFTRDELTAAVAEGSVIVAPQGSIARRMLEEWYGGEVVEPSRATASG
ncbi:MAG: NAD(+) diphosphatase [Actinobacteria bacterium HGW-Actinobacteria-4]|nr:MAG: NAD(+) diphosphatase [Actinobacteria bacterium HGW-Actinobacteria-4]